MEVVDNNVTKRNLKTEICHSVVVSSDAPVQTGRFEDPSDLPETGRPV